MLLHPRTPPRRVGEVIELLYVNACGTCGERLVYATERNDWNYPYRAHSPDWRGRDCTGLVCGKNPYLYARLVEHVTVEHGGHGAEMLRWREIEVLMPRQYVSLPASRHYLLGKFRPRDTVC